MSASAPIAVVGMACRLSGDVNSPTELWNLVSQKGSTLMTEIPRDRWNVDSFYHPNKDRKGTMHMRGGHFLKSDLACFDAPFFSITPSEAKAMDPQQRFLLEVTYEAIENAGIPLASFAGSNTSCYIGDFSSKDYEANLNRDIQHSVRQRISGNSMSILSNRISYCFNLKGPSITLDTACSSSLAALHLACQSLRSGEAQASIVGGVNLMLSPDMTIGLDALNLLSPDSRCFAFDERANGYVRGEGFVVLILRPLELALKNRDAISAVIHGSGLNQDGQTRGLHLPNPDAQAALIRETYRACGLDLKDTSYCEAHGTGTLAGDTLEAKALGTTFGDARHHMAPLIVSSVKTNIGHLEGCAGLAGVVKTILAFEHGVIPPSANFQRPNPRIPFKLLNIEVATCIQAWPAGPRRASVNSFGFGGTNAHVILEDPLTYLASKGLEHATIDILSKASSPPISQANYNRSGDQPTRHNFSSSRLRKYDDKTVPKLFVWSFHDENAMSRQRPALVRYFREIQGRVGDGQPDNLEETTFLNQLSFTLLERRTLFPWKSYCIASSIDEICDKVDSKMSKPVNSTKVPRVAFLFTGQGAQWHAMGRELVKYQVYGESLLEADAYLKTLGCKWSVYEELQREESESNIKKSAYAQPLSAIVQVALVELLRSWHITPCAVLGHSSGEIAAAYCAGLIARETAWKLSYARGQIHAPSGGMMAVGLSEKEARKYLDPEPAGRVTVGCVNSPKSVTLSGVGAELDALQEKFERDGVFAKRLAVDAPYHSHHMASAMAAYSEALAGVWPPPSIGDQDVKFYSWATGAQVDEATVNRSEYWVSALTSKVRFPEAIQSMAFPSSSGRRTRKHKGAIIDAWLEIGAHCVLKEPLKQSLDGEAVQYTSLLRRREDAVITALGAAGLLWCLGYPVDLSTLNQHHENPQQPISLLTNLPSYPWNHNMRHWFESAKSIGHRNQKHPRLDLLGAPVGDTSMPTWRHFLRMSEIPWMADYQINHDIPYPSWGIIAMTVEAANQLAYDASQEVIGYELRDVCIERNILIPASEEGVEVWLYFKPISEAVGTSSWNGFTVISKNPNDAESQLVASGLIITQISAVEPSDWFGTNEQEFEDEKHRQMYRTIKDESSESVKRKNFYFDLGTIGMIYGPTFMNLHRINVCGEKGCYQLQVPDTARTMPDKFEYPHVIHPALLQSLTQMMLPALSKSSYGLPCAVTETHIDNVYISALCTAKAGATLEGYSTSHWIDPCNAEGSVTLSDPTWERTLVTVKNMRLVTLPGAQDSSQDSGVRKICSEMTWKPDLRFLPSECKVSIEEYLDYTLHKLPTSKVLMVGDQRADLSRSLLEHVHENVDLAPRFSSWTCTSAQLEDLEPAKRVLARWQPAVHFLDLDLDQISSQQGDERETYDVVIARLLMDEHTDIRETLDKLRLLLNEHSTLLIMGTTMKLPDERFSSVEDIRCSIYEKVKIVLADQGFGGIKQLSCSQEPNTCALSALYTECAELPRKDTVIVEPRNASARIRKLSSELVKRLAANEIVSTTAEFGQMESQIATGKFLVMLLEIDVPLLSSLSAKDFLLLKRLLLESQSVLWINKSSAANNEYPDMNIIVGLARTSRNETMSRFATLQLSLDAEDGGLVKRPASEEQIASSIFQIALSMTQESTHAVVENEYVLQDGRICVPRLSLLPDLDDQLISNGGPCKPVHEQLNMEGSPILVENKGGHLRITKDAGIPQDLGSHEVEIIVKASSIGPSDLVGFERTIGNECAGIVSRLGHDVRDFSVGDRVMIWGRACQRSLARCSSAMCQLIPSSLSFDAAACVPMAYCTAYEALHSKAQLERAESILIHDSGDGVDEAAIILARHVGANVFVATANPRRRDFFIESLNIDEHQILHSNSLSFAKTVLHVTEGKGVDVVLNSCRGEIMAASWDCLARNGRFIDLGQYLDTKTSLDIEPFRRGASFISVDMTAMYDSRPSRAALVLREVGDLLRLGEIVPLSSVMSYKLSELPDAETRMRARESVNKVVLLYEDGDSIAVVPAAAKRCHFHPGASYVLSGGLGGLGRSIAAWMVGRGARSLILLSRSGAQSEEAQEAVAEMGGKGARISVVTCDIANICQLRGAISECEKELPPIRGVIQAAMDLRDSTFENMSAEDWTASLKPKVSGSRNLHEQMPQDLDFFIMISSCVGVCGHKGQANYAAGNTFQDALAHHRRGKGLPATSIDLGWIVDAGILVDQPEKAQHLMSSGLWGLYEAELLRLLEVAITDEGSTLPAQIITGLSTGGMVKQSGATDVAWMEDAKFAHLRAIGSRRATEAGEKSAAPQLKALLHDAVDHVAATAVVRNALVGRIAQSTGMDSCDVDVEKPVREHGIDSLVAIDLRSWAAKQLKADVSSLLILSGIPIGELAEKMALASGLVKRREHQD